MAQIAQQDNLVIEVDGDTKKKLIPQNTQLILLTQTAEQ